MVEPGGRRADADIRTRLRAGGPIFGLRGCWLLVLGWLLVLVLLHLQEGLLLLVSARMSMKLLLLLQESLLLLV